MTDALGLICVYASSSMNLQHYYYDLARDLGKAMLKNGYGLCFGGGKLGLMGAIADEILNSGGRVTGVIPDALNVKDVVHEKCHEIIVTRTMRERKQRMEDMSSAFIALPGGFGTLEELLEIITLKQLSYHKKPIVILNGFGFYDQLIGQFERIVSEGFAGADTGELYFITGKSEEALEYIKSYDPEKIAFDKIRDMTAINTAASRA